MFPATSRGVEQTEHGWEARCAAGDCWRTWTSPSRLRWTMDRSTGSPGSVGKLCGSDVEDSFRPADVQPAPGPRGKPGSVRVLGGCTRSRGTGCRSPQRSPRSRTRLVGAAMGPLTCKLRRTSACGGSGGHGRGAEWTARGDWPPEAGTGGKWNESNSLLKQPQAPQYL